MTVRHVVCITWTPEARPEDIAAASDAVAALPELIPDIRAFSVGRDLGLAPGTADLAIVADFDSADAWQRYEDHPEHQRVLGQHLRPLMAARAAVQFDLNS